METSGCLVSHWCHCSARRKLVFFSLSVLIGCVASHSRLASVPFRLSISEISANSLLSNLHRAGFPSSVDSVKLDVING